RSTLYHPTRLHSFPTRRSSDLFRLEVRTEREVSRRTTLLSDHRGGYSGRPADQLSEDTARNGAVLDCRAQWRAGAAVDRSNHAGDRKSTRLNSSHLVMSYAVFC